MATKTIAETLLIKPGSTIWLSEVDRRRLIEPLPENVQVAAGPEEAAIALIFATDSSSL